MNYYPAAFALAVCFIPSAVLADEKWDAAHCKATFETGDWAPATLYCEAAAADYSADALGSRGYARSLDLALEGIAMGEVGFAYRELSQANSDAQAARSAELAYRAAARTLNQAQSSTRNRQLLQMIEDTLDTIEQQSRQ